MDISAKRNTQSDKLQSTSTPTKQAWTPGPWFSRHSFERSEIVAGRTVIAETQNSQAANEELNANDKLIAKAPEMAEALTWAMERLKYIHAHFEVESSMTIFEIERILREAGAM